MGKVEPPLPLPSPLPSREFLVARFSYDPETGLVTRASGGRGKRAGELVGRRSQPGYLMTQVYGRPYLLHRVVWKIMTGCDPVEQIDHVNGNPSDNRWANLREASPHQNKGNRKISRNSKSGCKGVSWKTNRNKWRAQIRYHGRQKHLGFFDDLDAAKAAYRSAAVAYFGEAFVCTERR